MAIKSRLLSKLKSTYVTMNMAATSHPQKMHGIELEQISPYATVSTCSGCDGEGKREQYDFVCENCGLKLPAALNIHGAKQAARRQQAQGVPR